MTVSVLIPYYNDREYLPRAIDSVLNQTYTDFELILVNHATTDDCREIARSYKDPRIKHIDMDKNYGAGTGLIVIEFLKQAKGKYVKLFCADDVMYPNCLEDMVKYMDTHPEIDFAFGDVEYINENEKSMKKSWFEKTSLFSLKNDEIACLKLYFKGFSTLPYIGSFAKREIFNSIKIDKCFIMTFDMSLWTSLLLKGYKIGYLNKYIAGYRVHDGQMCSYKAQKLISQRCEFEAPKFIELFFEIEDTNLIKKIFNKNVYIKNNINIEPQDIKFIVAYEMLQHFPNKLRIPGYMYIYECLNNDKKRKYLEDKFSFGITDFRKMYSKCCDASEIIKASQLSFPKLWYLFRKKIFFILTFRDFIDKTRKRTL